MVPEALHTPRVGTGQGMALGARASMMQQCASWNPTASLFPSAFISLNLPKPSLERNGHQVAFKDAKRGEKQQQSS